MYTKSSFLYSRMYYKLAGFFVGDVDIGFGGVWAGGQKDWLEISKCTHLISSGSKKPYLLISSSVTTALLFSLPKTHAVCNLNLQSGKPQ